MRRFIDLQIVMLTLPVRAIFFDAVGTLIHPVPSPVHTYRETAHRCGSTLSDAAIAERFRQAFDREEEHDRAQGLRTSEAREEARWRTIVGSVLDDVRDAASCFAELWDHFSRSSAWRCEPGTAETLGELAARGCLLGMASNYDSRLRGVVAGLPELRAVRHLVISSEVGWRKPAPGFFAAVQKAAGVPVEEILFVGDDPGNDYRGARDAGMQAMLYNPQGREDKELCVGNLGQLLNMVANANR